MLIYWPHFSVVRHTNISKRNSKTFHIYFKTHNCVFPWVKLFLHSRCRIFHPYYPVWNFYVAPVTNIKYEHSVSASENSWKFVHLSSKSSWEFQNMLNGLHWSTKIWFCWLKHNLWWRWKGENLNENQAWPKFGQKIFHISDDFSSSDIHTLSLLTC